jgi:prespore-specific regulator
MSKPRQDRWTSENDTVLAETVLKHIRAGSTQLAAFEEAAEILQRTSAACGFRWNSEVRRQYEAGIKQAKIDRKANRERSARKRTSVVAGDSRSTEIFATVSQAGKQEADYLDQIVYLAQNQKLQLANMAKQIKTLNEQLKHKDREVEHLKRELEEAKAQPTEFTINEDYKTLLDILKRARQMGAIEEADREKHEFRVDVNGNIEMIG